MGDTWLDEVGVVAFDVTVVTVIGAVAVAMVTVHEDIALGNILELLAALTSSFAFGTFCGRVGSGGLNSSKNLRLFRTLFFWQGVSSAKASLFPLNGRRSSLTFGAILPFFFSWAG